MRASCSFHRKRRCTSQRGPHRIRLTAMGHFSYVFGKRYLRRTPPDFLTFWRIRVGAPLLAVCTLAAPARAGGRTIV